MSIQKQPTIIAIDPGTREIGFAILSGEELLYYGVKTVTNRKIPSNILETVTTFIKSLLERHQPSMLAIEKVFVTQNTSALSAVVAEQIKAIARECGISICEYAPALVRQRFCEPLKATKREVARLLSERYAELSRYYNRTRQWEIEYYAKLFDALAVGLICFEDYLSADSVIVKMNENVHA